MKPTDELSAMLRSADHEPLLNDDEIYRLLAAPPVAAQQPSPGRVWYYAAAATVAACAIGVYTLMPTDTGSYDASASNEESTTTAPQALREPVVLDEPAPAVEADDSMARSRTARSVPPVTFERATPELLAGLAIEQESAFVRFVDGRLMVTITNRGIGLRQARSASRSEAPVAVTLYDANGAYASWHDADAAEPTVATLRALRFALPDDAAMGRTNVMAVLWYAPRLDKVDASDASDWSDRSDRSDRSDAFRVERVAPNPVADDVATVTVNSTAQRAVRARLLDIAGRELMSLPDITTLHAGPTTVVISGLSRLPGGMVFLVIEDPASGMFVSERILLQR